VISRRLLTGFVASVGVLSTLFVPVASAQTTGRFERCAVQSPDFGTVVVAYTLDNPTAVQTAAAQCSFLISTGNFIAATNHVGLTDNPDFARVCVVEYSRSNSLNVFRSVYQPVSARLAQAACDAADDGTALVTYD
jgi:hypothetical protein